MPLPVSLIKIYNLIWPKAARLCPLQGERFWRKLLLHLKHRWKEIRICLKWSCRKKRSVALLYFFLCEVYIQTFEKNYQLQFLYWEKKKEKKEMPTRLHIQILRGNYNSFLAITEKSRWTIAGKLISDCCFDKAMWWLYSKKGVLIKSSPALEIK